MTTSILEEANTLLRSAYAIADRKGEDTNWEAFKNNIQRLLLNMNGIQQDAADEQLVLRCTCTPLTYRLPKSYGD